MCDQCCGGDSDEHMMELGEGYVSTRDFAFVTGEKDSCVLKGHVFRCNAPARAIATVLQDMCGKVGEGVRVKNRLG